MHNKPHTKEAKKKMRIAHMGHIPWNKNKKGSCPWAKNNPQTFKKGRIPLNKILINREQFLEKQKEESRQRALKYYRLNRKKCLEQNKQRRIQKYVENPNWYKEHYQKFKEKIKLSARKNNWKVRIKVLNGYGGKCMCCGETQTKFLCLDHIAGGGTRDRRDKKIHWGTPFYRWVIKNNFPNYLQVLCHNCNMAKGFYGKCPHQENEPNNIL